MEVDYKYLYEQALTEQKKLAGELAAIKYEENFKYVSDEIRLKYDLAEGKDRNRKLIKDNKIIEFMTQNYRYENFDKIINEGYPIDKIIDIIKDYLERLEKEERKETET